MVNDFGNRYGFGRQFCQAVNHGHVVGLFGGRPVVVAISRCQLRNDETNNHHADRGLDVAALIDGELLVGPREEEIEPYRRSNARDETGEPISNDRNCNNDDDEQER